MHGHFGLIALASLGVLWVFGLFHKSLLQIVHKSFEPLHNGLDDLYSWGRQRRRCFVNWIHGSLRSDLRTRDDQDEPNHYTSYLIGGFINMGLLVLFVASDLKLIQETLLGMGFGNQSLRVQIAGIPLNLDLLSAISLSGAAVFWGIVMMDLLGITHLMPWENGRPLVRAIFLTLSIVCVLVAVSVFIALGLYRSLSLIAIEQVEVRGAQSYSAFLGISILDWRYILSCFCSAGVPGLVSTSAACAAISLASVPKFIAIFVLALPLWTLGTAFLFLVQVAKRGLDIVYGIVEAIFVAIARMGVFAASPLLLISAIRERTELAEPVGSSDPDPAVDLIDMEEYLNRRGATAPERRFVETETGHASEGGGGPDEDDESQRAEWWREYASPHQQENQGFGHD